MRVTGMQVTTRENAIAFPEPVARRRPIRIRMPMRVPR
jgi:hypothetical protein